jgi:hypothetical protein
LANTGRPVVSTKWRTPWRGRVVPLPSPTMLGNDARRERTDGTMCEMDAANLDVAAATVQPTGWRDEANKTAVRMNETMNVWRPKVSFLVTFPHAEKGLPFAPDKSGPEVAVVDLCGKTETAAPVSTRNCCLETES